MLVWDLQVPELSSLQQIQNQLETKIVFSMIVVQEKGTWKNKQTVITFTRYGFSLRSDVAKNYTRGATHSQLKSYFYILFVVKRNLS